MPQGQVLSRAPPTVTQTTMNQQQQGAFQHPGFQQPGIVQQLPVVIQQSGMMPLQQQVVLPHTYPVGTTLIGAQQPNVVYQTTVPHVHQGYKIGQARVLGVMQIVLGGLSVVFMIAAMAIKASGRQSGSGFYCGGIVSI